MRTSWFKYDPLSDKVVIATGAKFLVSSLTGEKGVVSLLGSADKNIIVLGDIIDDLNGITDKIIELEGEKNTSLDGTKITAPILGSIDKIIELVGVDLYSYLDIHMDTSYVTFDYMDITFDRR
jgi:hypothetical protein